MKTLFALLLLALPGPSLSPEGERALATLLAAKRFTDDAIGYAGRTPEEVVALRALWKEKDPGPAFERLAREATLPGRLFGLCGLWYTDPKLFDEIVKPLRTLETPVPFQMGCEGGEMPVREIVDRGDAAVRLASREQSNMQWFAARPKDAPNAYYDIVGGGYPCLFKTGGGFRPLRPALSQEGDRALDALLAATRFTDDAIYDGGELPDEVRALRTLWKEKDPNAAFTHLALQATLPGRLFGLCGLWYTDPKLFDEIAKPLRTLDTEVPIQMGCMGGTMPVREIVDRGDRGVRLASREQSNKEWFDARPQDAPSAYYDIVGGGYPCLFKTGGGWPDSRAR